MAGVSITVIIGILAVFLTAAFQRKQWLRNTREEIRVRETKSAEELVRDVTRAFDKRITAQRFFLLNANEEDSNEFRVKYREAVHDYLISFNDIRARISYYFPRSELLYFEEQLHERIVQNGNSIAALFRQGIANQAKISELNSQLSTISAHVYQFSARCSEKISTSQIKPIQRLDDWKDHQNEFIGTWFLLRRLLSI